MSDLSDDGATFSILLVADSGRLAALAAGLSADGRVWLRQRPTLAQARETLTGRTVDALLVDADLSDGAGVDLVRLVSRSHPFVNQGLVSDLSAEEFHETFEGLGLFIQIPPDADAEFAREILQRLARIQTLSGPAPTRRP
ncbi:MAG: hypothetical protein LBU39_09525 [Desulfobulbaceae bacterium]|jgi:DNA-binding NtrC family response regulator|nr:hypothetical protein [Desulfobulbaceae bacterium]